MIVGCAVSAGPAPMPLSLSKISSAFKSYVNFAITYTQAPMKLLYDFAFALQILLAKQIIVEIMRTGLLPKHV
jgi:hypothetical protein